MSPTSSLMRGEDSQDSYDPPIPYDSHETPPDYASSPLLQREHTANDDETPLIVHQKRKRGIETGAMDCDEFGYELGRVAYDVTTLCSIVDEIVRLKSEANREDSPTSTLEALARRTTSASLLLSSAVPSLRTLAARLNYLKPAAGSFVVSTEQTIELKGLLARCADTLKSVLDKVKQLERAEEEGKKDARVRLLRIIKSRESKETDQAELMALLFGAERDGEKDVESLLVDSFGWRWAVERPGVRLARSLQSVGDLTFLDHIEHPATPAPSVWASPWSYVPKLYASDNRKVSGYSAAGTKESMPVDASDEETGNYGQSIAPTSTKRAPRYKLWIYVMVVMLILGGTGAGVGLWITKLSHPTSSGGREAGAEEAMSTFVNHMPAHSTVSSVSLFSLSSSSSS